MTTAVSITQAAKSSGVSLREKSLSALQNRIGEAPDDAAAFRRARICLSAGFFRPTMPEDERAAVTAEYAKAVSDMPGWAVEEAWDAIMREEAARTPRPADVRKRAQEALGRVAAELAYRRRIEAEKQAELEAERRRQLLPDSDRRAAILAEANLGAAIKRFPSTGDRA